MSQKRNPVRDFYAKMCRLDRWSTHTLQSRIDSMLFERNALSKMPDELIRLELGALRNDARLTPDLVFRDPYFLGLKDHYLEKDLEDAILPFEATERVVPYVDVRARKEGRGEGVMGRRGD
jgi:predicted nuclease of restriction endonuclease-like (RecB) superfamily